MTSCPFPHPSVPQSLPLSLGLGSLCLCPMSLTYPYGKEPEEGGAWGPRSACPQLFRPLMGPRGCLRDTQGPNLQKTRSKPTKAPHWGLGLQHEIWGTACSHLNARHKYQLLHKTPKL